MAVNNFLPFAPTDTGTNLLTQSEYAADTQRTNGNQPGQARSKLVNKAMRQSSAVASAMGSVIGTLTGTDVIDDGIAAKLQQQLTAMLMRLPPVFDKKTSGTANINLTYYFFTASANATAAATYTNNGITFTVVSTVAAGTTFSMTGNGAPAVSGTLTKASGTGDATIAFYAFRAPSYLRVRMVGGGGGGGGGGTSGGTDGGTGGDTLFYSVGSGSTSLLVANGGGGGKGMAGAPLNSGGSATINSPAYGTSIQGGPGTGVSSSTTGAIIYLAGGAGASTPFGGGGGAGPNNNSNAPAVNSGGGGGGGSSNNTSGVNGGAGGSAGGYIDAIIPNPTGAYTATVGASGTAGAAPNNGYSPTVGALGYIEMMSFY